MKKTYMTIDRQKKANWLGELEEVLKDIWTMEKVEELFEDSEDYVEKCMELETKRVELWSKIVGGDMTFYLKR